MRFLSVLFLALAACPGTSKDSDSVATDDSTGTDCTQGTPQITDSAYNCDGLTPESCTFHVESDFPMGVVTLTITETGDLTSTCGPKGDVNECGVWQETHNGLTVAGAGTTGGECGERKEITLDVKDASGEQQDNASTLFGTQVLDRQQTTILVQITDGTGAAADCDTYGHDVSYFNAECSN